VSKYLKSSTSTSSSHNDKLRHSAYVSPPRTGPATRSGSDAKPASVDPQSGTTNGTTDYTVADLQQFSALSTFPTEANTHKKAKRNGWASCQFTDQDNVGLQKLQQDLNAAADSTR